MEALGADAIRAVMPRADRSGIPQAEAVACAWPSRDDHVVPGDTCTSPRHSCDGPRLHARQSGARRALPPGGLWVRTVGAGAGRVVHFRALFRFGPTARRPRRTEDFGSEYAGPLRTVRHRDHASSLSCRARASSAACARLRPGPSTTTLGWRRWASACRRSPVRSARCAFTRYWTNAEPYRSTAATASSLVAPCTSDVVWLWRTSGIRAAASVEVHAVPEARAEELPEAARAACGSAT